MPLVLFALLCLAGCSRSADPLDWKIKSGDPAQLEKWLNGHMMEMPLDLANELTICLNNIRADTLPGVNSLGKDYRYCERVDGRTVREVLIEGHEISHHMMRTRINNQSDAVIRLLKTAPALGTTELRKHEELMNTYLAVRTAWERKLKDSEKRVAALKVRPEPK